MSGGGPQARNELERFVMQPQIQHALPLTRVTRQTRHFQAHHDAHLPQADICDQSLETVTITRSTGLTKVAINDANLLFRPAQAQRFRLQPILSFFAFTILWAMRLKRLFGIDIETCSECGGDVRIIPKALASLAGQALASIEDPAVIKKILDYLE